MKIEISLFLKLGPI